MRRLEYRISRLALIAGCVVAPRAGVAQATAEGASSQERQDDATETKDPASSQQNGVAPQSDRERATALFDQARAAMSNGGYRTACSLFERSYAYHPGIGTEFNWADCLQKLGEKALAYEHFRRVAERTQALGQPERQRAAEQRVSALEGELGQLLILVESPPEGLVIRRNGKPVPRESWGQSFAVALGPQQLEATAPGRKPWTIDVELDRAGATLAVPVPPLGAEAPGPVTTKAVSVEAPVSNASPSRPAPDEVLLPKDYRRTAQLVMLTGAGAGAIVAGTSFLFYKMRNNDAESVCPTSVDCSLSEVERHDELLRAARTARSLGYVGLGMAGVSLVTFTIVSMARPNSRSGSDSVAARVQADLASNGTLGASIRGTW